jgi:hypothetical protein
MPGRAADSSAVLFQAVIEIIIERAGSVHTMRDVADVPSDAIEFPSLEAPNALTEAYRRLVDSKGER